MELGARIHDARFKFGTESQSVIMQESRCRMVSNKSKKMYYLTKIK